jgi:predicted DNA-binding transcriptional regulator YafY
MVKNSSMETTTKMIKLIIMMNSKSGTTIPEIMKTLGVSRATAFRMKKSAIAALEGRAEYDHDAPEEDHLLRKHAKAETGKGRDWTYRVYSPGKNLIFNDVGVETIRALKAAHSHLTTAGLSKEAAELHLLLGQVNDRLGTRHGAWAPAEALLETSGVGRRVSQRVQSSPETLTALQRCILDDRAIRFRYWLRSQRKAVTYRVDPLGVIFHRFAYLVCVRHDARRKGPITLRVDEISKIEALKDRRKVPKGFNLQSFADQSFGAFFGVEPLSVVWRFSPSKADEAEKFIFHPSQTQERQDDGSLIVSFTAKGSVEMCWELFQWGSHVEIVAPERLQREYVRLCGEIAESAKRYDSAASS